jgi:hypothetical protein
VVRRVALAALLAATSVGCSSGVEDVTEALSPSGASTPTATASSSPTADTSGPTGPTTGEPAIVVRTPQPGDEVVSPVRIAGTADVFEATVSIVMLDEDGQELAATVATATCGTGCRGRFSASVSFFTQARRSGTIEVFEVSAKDGSPLHLVSIPVVLVPGP